MKFPVDDSTLMAVEHALQGSYEEDDNGEPVLSGSDYSLWELLDFLSGITDEDYQMEYDEDGEEYYVCRKPSLAYEDVIKALIQEIKRLRELVPEDKREVANL